MNRERKKEIVLKTMQDHYDENQDDLADEIVSSLEIMENAEAIANIAPDLSELEIKMSKLHLAKARAALEMIELDICEVEFKIDTIKVFVPYRDKVADILRHAIAELEKAIRNEENDWWE